MSARHAAGLFLLFFAVGCAESALVTTRGTRDASLDSSVDASDSSVDASDASADASDASMDASDASMDGSDSSMDASPPTDCTPGAVDCFGWVPRLCSAEGRWNPGTRCPEVCDRGACVRCLPAQRRCTAPGGGGIEVCSNDHTWVATPCSGADCYFCGGDIPADCTLLGGECGFVNDGLGGLANCDAEIGGCPSGFVCGAGAEANTCVASNPDAMKECTPGAYDCGGAVERRCSRTGKWLLLLPGEPCGTVPEACTQHGYNCGRTNDYVIGMVECGPCPAGYACGTQSVNRCSPVP